VNEIIRPAGPRGGFVAMRQLPHPDGVWVMMTREKILVGLAVLALGVGAIDKLLPRSPSASKPPAAQSIEGLPAFISKIADATREGHAEANAGILKKAEAEWPQNPFLKIKKPQAAAPAETAKVEKTGARPRPNLTYTGYIDMGEKRLAIINGMEYETGDQVEPGGLVVKSILPGKVVMVYNRGEGAPIELSLKESE
jgi:hypothetical protein